MRIRLLLLAGLITLAALSSTLTAQPEGTRIVFVDAQATVEGHPQGAEIERIRTQARDELEPIREELDTIVQRARGGETLSAEDRSNLDLLNRTLEQTSQRYNQEADALLQPILEQVDTIIQQVAQENGYSMVLDGNIAGSAGLSLVLFAQQDLDITEQVIERLQ